METSHKLKVLQTCQVAPPLGSAAKTTTLPLTFFDLPLLLSSQSELLFFYNFPIQTSHFMTSLLPQIKHSLSLTLQHYYPLAGNLTWSPQSHKPSILYVNGDSIPLTIAESINPNFNHLSGNHPRDPNEFHPLIPQLSSSEKLVSVLAIQITLFPDSGICIGITSHHAAIDGRTTAMFLKSWASVFKLGKDDSSIPFYDRTVIKDPNGFEELYLQGLSQFMHSKSMSKHDCNNWVFASKSLKSLEKPLAATFELSKSDIARLKQKWNFAVAGPKIDNKETSEVVLVHPSSFQLVCAYTWVCLTRAGGVGDGDEDVNILYVVDFRGRLHPQIPSTYFGNCFMGVKVSAKRGDIVGEDGIVVAVNSIMKEMKGLREGFVRNSEERFQRVLSTGPKQFFATAGSTRFGLSKVDFGWGRPKKVELTSVARTGAIFFTESGKEDGRVEISFVRSEKEMEAFGVLFVNGLKDLFLSQKKVFSSL